MTLNNKVILPGSTIGIIGGGQLGKMLSIAAKNMGYKTVVVDPSIAACAKGVADKFLATSYTEENSLKYLAENTDVITFEFENIPATAVEFLENNGGYVPQSYTPLAISQDRLLEKEKLEAAGFKVAPYAKIDTLADLENAVEQLGLPAILKTRSGGYDGKGQFVIKSSEDIEEASELLAAPCILEKKLEFTKEVSIIAFKGVNGDFEALPIGENVHKNGILHTTIVPTTLSAEVENKVRTLTNNFFEQYNIFGILTIELFVVNNDIVANEIAPRPHNSGHWSLDGAKVSQFEEHLRAICGLSLLEAPEFEVAGMINVLGQHYDNLTNNMLEVTKIAKVHLYGKEGNAHNRKIGHINVTAVSKKELEEKIEKIVKIIEG